MRKFTRRRILQIIAAAAVTGGVAVAADGRLFSPAHPRLARIAVPLPRLPAAWDGLTIAQLSDFHYDDFFTFRPIRRAVEIVKGLQPDLIVLTGDFVTVPVLNDYVPLGKWAAKAIDPCAELLSQLHARLGVWAVLGNHDIDSDPGRIVETLQSKNIPVLRNRSIPLEHAGTRLWLSGVDDVMEGKPNLDITLHGVPQNEPVILLAHEPDFADQAAKYPIDLQLSGHSHGGQVRLPLIGAPWLPDLAKKYPWGMRRIGGLTLYTNRGLGTIRVPVRLNCPPEITLFTLRALAR